VVRRPVGTKRAAGTRKLPTAPPLYRWDEEGSTSASPSPWDPLPRSCTHSMPQKPIRGRESMESSLPPRRPLRAQSPPSRKAAAGPRVDIASIPLKPINFVENGEIQVHLAQTLCEVTSSRQFASRDVTLLFWYVYTTAHLFWIYLGCFIKYYNLLQSN
jgi:hypothetical protein